MWNIVNPFQSMYVKKYHASKVKKKWTIFTQLLGTELPEMVLSKSVLTLATVS